MIVREFRTDDVPQEERFSRWREATSSLTIRSLLRTEHEADFRASSRSLDLGPVQVSRVKSPTLESVRTPKLIRQTDSDYHLLVLNVRGGNRFAQGQREAVIGPGDMFLCDPSQPWHGWAGTGKERTFEGVFLLFAKALLPIPASRVHELAAVRLPGRESLNSLLSSYLTQLISDDGEYHPTDGARLATLTLDLLTAWCTHHLDAEADLPPETRHDVLRTRVHAFIEHHLGDPALSPASIAAAHHISTRFLHRLFNEQGMTVASRIRQRRLERCHRDLADPQLSSQLISAIATRWGFPNPAQFARTFRTAYGMAPTDFRDMALDSLGVRPAPTAAARRPATADGDFAGPADAGA